MAGWADLPTDILILIARRMICIEDFVCLSYVCKPWQILTSILQSRPSLPPRFPWVMLPEVPSESNNGGESRQRRRFYSLSATKTHEFELPEAAGRKCLGAYHGCLLTLGSDFQINILHPFSRQQTALPPLLTFKHQMPYSRMRQPQRVIYYVVVKVVMSRSPYGDDFLDNKNKKREECVVLAIYGPHRSLAFARPGDEMWTEIVVVGPRTFYKMAFGDVIFFDGKFYAISLCDGILYDIQFDKDFTSKATTLALSPFTEFCGPDAFNTKYLFESCGDLLLVCRSRCTTLMNGFRTINWSTNRSQRHSTTGFSVFRLEKCHGDEGYPYKWTEVNSLGDRALFLGNNVSVSMSPSNCVKANCIYFSEDDVLSYKYDPDGGGHDTGIFHMNNNTIESHYASEFCCPLAPPLWYM